MKPCGLRTMAILIIGMALSGCAATNPVISEWRNPAYSSTDFKRILVSAPGFATSIRRNLEDEFVARLRAAGDDASASYARIPDENPDEPNIKQAAQKLGADAALVVRPLQVERRTDYGPSYFPAPWFGYYGPHFGANWYGWYGAPSVYRYNEYTSEATLHDIAKNEVVWSGTIRTSEVDDMRKATKNYVDAVMRALNDENLLAKSNQRLGGM